MIGWIAGILALVLGIGVLASGRTMRDPWAPPGSAGLQQLRALCEAVQVPESWIQFLAMTAYGESRWNNLAGLGNPALFPSATEPNLNAAEVSQHNAANAAAIAYERNAAVLSSCGHPPEHYRFGAGGWFALLPGNALANLAGTELVCLAPAAVFEPAASLVMALAMARKLQSRASFRAIPTWLNLRVGWGDPSQMGQRAVLSGKRDKFDAHRKAAALPTGWLDQHVPELPEFDPVAMLEAMRRVEMRGEA